MSANKGDLTKVRPERIRFADRQATENCTFRNARQTLKKEEMTQTRESIRKLGVLKPPIVRPVKNDPNHDFEMIAGSRRLRCILRLKEEQSSCFNQETEEFAPASQVYEYLKVFVRDCDDDTAIMISIAENLEHSAVPDLDLMEWCEELISIKKKDSDEPLYSRTRIAELINRSESWVSLTLGLRDLPREYKKLMYEGRLSRTGAIALMLGANKESYSAVLTRCSEKLAQEAATEEAAAIYEHREAILDVQEAESEAAIAEMKKDDKAKEQAEKKAKIGKKRVSVASEKKNAAKKKAVSGQFTADIVNQSIREIPGAQKGKPKALTPKNLKEKYEEFCAEIEKNTPTLETSLVKSVIEVCLGRKVVPSFLDLIEEEKNNIKLPLHEEEE